MSDTEYHYGKLRKLDLQGKTKEEFFKEKCIEKGEIKLDEDTWEEEFLYNIDSELYFPVGEDIYEAFEHEESEDSYIQKLIPHEDGTFTFIMSFYNGGTCLKECIEESLEEYLKYIK